MALDMDKLEKTIEDIKGLEQKRSDLVTEINRYMTSKSELEKDIAGKQKKLSEIQGAIVDGQKTIEKESARLKKIKDSEIAEILKKQHELSGEEIGIADRKKEADAIFVKAKQEEKRVINKEKEVDLKIEKYEKDLNALMMRENRINSTEANLERMKKELSEVSSGIEDLKSSWVVKHEKVAEAEKANVKRSKELEAEAKQLENDKEAHREANRILIATQKDVNQKIDGLNELIKKNNILKKEAEALSDKARKDVELLEKARVEVNAKLFTAEQKEEEVKGIRIYVLDQINKINKRYSIKEMQDEIKKLNNI